MEKQLFFAMCGRGLFFLVVVLGVGAGSVGETTPAPPPQQAHGTGVILMIILSSIVLAAFAVLAVGGSVWYARWLRGLRQSSSEEEVERIMEEVRRVQASPRLVLQQQRTTTTTTQKPNKRKGREQTNSTQKDATVHLV